MVEPPDSKNVGLNKLKSTLVAVLMSQSWPKVFVGCVHSDHLLREGEFVCRTVRCSQSVICLMFLFFVREERLACKAGKIIGKDSSARYVIIALVLLFRQVFRF